MNLLWCTEDAMIEAETIGATYWTCELIAFDRKTAW